MLTYVPKKHGKESIPSECQVEVYKENIRYYKGLWGRKGQLGEATSKTAGDFQLKHLQSHGNVDDN